MIRSDAPLGLSDFPQKHRKRKRDATKAFVWSHKYSQDCITVIAETHTRMAFMEQTISEICQQAQSGDIRLNIISILRFLQETRLSEAVSRTEYFGILLSYTQRPVDDFQEIIRDTAAFVANTIHEMHFYSLPLTYIGKVTVLHFTTVDKMLSLTKERAKWELDNLQNEVDELRRKLVEERRERALVEGRCIRLEQEFDREKFRPTRELVRSLFRSDSESCDSEVFFDASDSPFENRGACDSESEVENTVRSPFWGPHWFNDSSTKSYDIR
ncbi:hypothetical protein QR680_006087 [Steinernema hermaphroditum]|uniref:Uncharacterized protein n=1 Tax=Steinernema hermaphroditum TaxID=289476 RepID=A0AA39LWT6_9BILA|nr:hypothetical protein QR680_006087 [Steinernema hermaphroditum]